VTKYLPAVQLDTKNPEDADSVLVNMFVRTEVEFEVDEIRSEVVRVDVARIKVL